MTDRSTTQHPTAPPDIDAYLARFGWHPEPELVGYRDEGASREALERLGDATWRAALDFLYGPAADRAMGDPSPYDEVRRRYFGRSARARAGADRTRSRPPRSSRSSGRASRAGQMNAQHPRQFGYFTPPPLPMSIMGELLAQIDQPGRRRLARRAGRRVRRGGGRALAVRPRRVRGRLVRAADARAGSWPTSWA